MSDFTTEYNRVKNNINTAYNTIANKGGILPTINNSVGLANAINTIGQINVNYAIANDILEGKKAYVNGETITGTMVNYGNINITPGNSIQSLGAGYYNKINIGASTPLTQASMINSILWNNGILEFTPNAIDTTNTSIKSYLIDIFSMNWNSLTSLNTAYNDTITDIYISDKILWKSDYYLPLLANINSVRGVSNLIISHTRGHSYGLYMLNNINYIDSLPTFTQAQNIAYLCDKISNIGNSNLSNMTFVYANGNPINVSNLFVNCPSLTDISWINTWKCYSSNPSDIGQMSLVNMVTYCYNLTNIYISNLNMIDSNIKSIGSMIYMPSNNKILNLYINNIKSNREIDSMVSVIHGNNFYDTNWTFENFYIENIHSTNLIHAISIPAFRSIYNTDIHLNDWHFPLLVGFASNTFVQSSPNLNCVYMANWNSFATAYINGTYNSTIYNYGGTSISYSTNKTYIYFKDAKHIYAPNWNICNLSGSSIFLRPNYSTNLISCNMYNWNIAKTNNLASYFSNLQKLTTLNIDNWDTANIKYLNYMFSYCNNLSSSSINSVFNFLMNLNITQLASNSKNLYSNIANGPMNNSNITSKFTTAQKEQLSAIGYILP